MYSLTILILGLFPTLLLFGAARLDAWGIGPSPLTIMGWTWLFGYTLKSIYLSFAVVYDLPFRPDWIAADIVDVGQMMITVGVISMIVGYLVFASHIAPHRTRTLPPRPWPVDPRLVYFPFMAISMVLLAIFFYRMGFVQQIATGRFFASKFFVDEQGVRHSLGFLSVGGDFLLVLFIYYLAMAKRLTWVNVYTVTMAFLLLTLFLASRRNVVIALVVLALIVLAIRSVDRNLLKRLMRLAFIGVIFASLSLASQVRDASREGLALSQLNVLHAIRATTVHAFEGAYFIDPAKTAAIVDKVDATNRFMGLSFVGFIIAPIPRVLWNDKPSVRVGPFVAQQLFGFNSQAGVPPGAVGEFYLNFGLMGVVLGMMLFGAGLAYLWWRHRNAVDPRFTIVRYAFLMVAAIYFVNVEFSAAIVIFIKYYIAILIAEQYWRFQLAREGRLGIDHIPRHMPVSPVRRPRAGLVGGAGSFR
ncbi:MAG: O-antigen polymerase [Pseudomonadota bacterium]